jgi:hypothetical protein
MEGKPNKDDLKRLKLILPLTFELADASERFSGPIRP